MTGKRPGSDRGQRQREAEMIEAKCPGWVVMYGAWSRQFWAFGAPDGSPITALSASELLGHMRAAERSQSGPYYER